MSARTVHTSLQQILNILIFLNLLDIITATSISTPETIAFNRTSDVVDTGVCPFEFVDSEAACAIQCYRTRWCRVYVAGSCDLDTRNPCLCVMCQMDVLRNPGSGEPRSFGTISTPKRLVDGSCSTKWKDVHPNCTTSVSDISSNFSSSPILVLRLDAIETNTSGISVYNVRPVCPAFFTLRGLAYCVSDEGIWHDQNTLACFPTMCTQKLGDKDIFAGYTDVTKSGRSCWTWEDEAPFNHRFLDSSAYVFDELDIKKAKNYCRVFLDQVAYQGPWCYNGNYNITTDPLTRESCNLPECHAVY